MAVCWRSTKAGRGRDCARCIPAKSLVGAPAQGLLSSPGKSEFGCESVRIWPWEDRLKLLCMAMLAHAFLLRLMDMGPVCELVRRCLLQQGCPRTGWHCRCTFFAPSRLREALCWWLQ